MSLGYSPNHYFGRAGDHPLAKRMKYTLGDRWSYEDLIVSKPTDSVRWLGTCQRKTSLEMEHAKWSVRDEKVSSAIARLVTCCVIIQSCVAGYEEDQSGEVRHAICAIGVLRASKF